MKHILMLLLLIWSTVNLFGQKPEINPSMYNKIPYSGSRCISNDGKYIAYEIKKGPHYSGTSLKIIIQSTLTDWKLEIPKAAKSVGKITSDSKHWIFMTRTDSLGVLDLENKAVKYISNVSNFDIPENGLGEWLIYESNSTEKTIVLYNLKTGKEISFSNVSLYKFDEYGKELVIVDDSKKEAGNQSIIWMNLINRKKVVAWSGKSIENLSLDFKHQQLAFKTDSSIYYYKKGMSKSGFLIGSKSNNKDIELGFGDIGNFSHDGSRLHLTLTKNLKDTIIHKGVEVWSYKDYPLESLQEKNIKSNRNSYQGVVLLSSHKLIQLENFSNEYILKGLNDDFALSVKIDPRNNGFGWYSDGFWNSAETGRIFSIVNTKTGESKELRWLSDICNSGHDANISPAGKYIVCYIPKYRGYLSYNMSSGELRNLTSSINTKWTQVETDDQKCQNPRGIAGWLPNDKAVLIYNQNDIWKLDPTGKTSPINLTNSYGKKNHVVFKLALEVEGGVIKPKNNVLVLSAFNLVNKENGFFKKNLNRVGDPDQCTMGQYVYTQVSGYHMPWLEDPIKAKDEEVYLVQRMNAKDPLNYFSTKDFKTFRRITSFRSEVEYNWYTTELHSWKSLEGRKLQGILYKPENFDPGKKYPVIFHYYERISDRLNAYLEPTYSAGPIDIATYVSNGYLVFTPDIHYNVGDPMQGSYDALVSAAQYVSTFPFVNSKKFGLQGHSFGAIQTNYIITHTGLFAAACSSSGISNFTSGYGSLGGNASEGYTGSLAGVYETGQTRMGSTLWENLEGYIKNSSIFQVDKVTTPLLMMHTKKDMVCPYANAMEFFLGLRRMGKKVWMLVYPEGQHTLEGEESVDFTIRMQQFFDHYLKDKLAPVWMLDGISAKERGIKSGLELDMTGRIPGPGLLTPEEQSKVNSLMTRKPITITIR